MRNKRKGGKSSKTLADNNGESEVESAGNGFYACYLLTSLSPRHKGHTYIGFTVNPKRRIRQHNGEITSGATRTKKKRPWEMTLCIYGFPTQVAALQFEWAWQHPTESLAVRKAACNLKSVAGLANKIIVAFTMLTLHTWQSMDLTVNFFSTKYMSHVAACPSLPKQMKVQFGTMDDLPCYSEGDQPLHNDEDDWDLDPQECNSGDEIEDLTRGNSDDGIRHCFDANASASSTENQADKESRLSQENNVLEPRDSVFRVEDDDYQKHYYEVDRLHQEFNAPVHVCAEKSAMTRTASIENKDTWCDQVQPSDERSLPQKNNVLEPRDSFFLIEDDYCQKHSNEVDRSDQEFNTPMRVCAEKSAMTRTTTVVIEDTPCNQAQPSEERSPLSNGATDETQSTTFRQIEVIDLFTPSPVYRDNTHGKKRKVNTEVIDLTRSPDFIEL